MALQYENIINEKFSSLIKDKGIDHNLLNDIICGDMPAEEIENILADLYNNYDQLKRSSSESSKKDNSLINSLWKSAEQEILPMLYSSPSIRIKVKINDIEYIALIDTGAETNIISKNIIEQCNLNDHIDERCKGIAYGVGQSIILGTVPYLNVSIGDFDKMENTNMVNTKGNKIFDCPCNFSVIDNDCPCDIILGQAFMMFYKVKLDFENRTIHISDEQIPMIIVDH